MKSSTQLPVRIALLILATLLVLAEEFGFESIFGAFAAGMIVGQSTRGAEGAPLREKLDAVSFGWFYPFFFVGAGIHFDLSTLVRDWTTALSVPLFAVLFLLVRGSTFLLYRKELAVAERLPFALLSSVPSLSIVVVITEIGVKAGHLNTQLAAALVGAAPVHIAVPDIGRDAGATRDRIDRKSVCESERQLKRTDCARRRARSAGCKAAARSSSGLPQCERLGRKVRDHPPVEAASSTLLRRSGQRRSCIQAESCPRAAE